MNTGGRSMAICSIIFCAVILFERSSCSQNTFLKKLGQTIQDLQTQNSSHKFKFLVPAYEVIGLYESFFKFNYHRGVLVSAIRKYFQALDDTMFSTVWITNTLLDVVKYGDTNPLSSDQITLALDAVDKFRDKNNGVRNSIMGYWRQVYNPLLQEYETTSFTLDVMSRLISYIPLSSIHVMSDWLGLTTLKSVTKELQYQMQFYDRNKHLPPDFDDTFVYIGLGSQLADLKSLLPDQHKQWMDHNPDPEAVIHALKKYAYRPFSTDINANTIDPRSYFYLRHFLNDARESGKDVALVNTWVYTVEDNQAETGNHIPGNVNGIDVVVVANVINGLTSGVLRGIFPLQVLDDPDIEKIVVNSTLLMAEQIQKNFSSRPDLALGYYTSRFMFYWFTARTLFILNNKISESHLPHAVLQTIRDILDPVLKEDVTRIIMSERKADEDGTYFDDFLGNADFDWLGSPVKHAEDRIFTTSLAVNILLHTWTVFKEETRTLGWRAEAPGDVMAALSDMVSWLVKHTYSGKYQPWNTFFSGDEKGHESLIYKFPINRLEYLNGSHAKSYTHLQSPRVVLGFQGVVSEVEYLQMCDKNILGYRTPMTFSGYNADSFPMAFGSSDAFTYASVMLGVAMYENIE